MKLALVLNGDAPEGLMDSYQAERHPAAAHNIKTTSRTTRFLSPQSQAERTLRDAVISLARDYAFARPLVNTGRMSVAYSYDTSPLTTNAGASVPNVPLTLPNGATGTLLDLFERRNCYLGLWFSAHGLTASDVRMVQRLQREEPLLRLVVYSEFGVGAPTLGDRGGKLMQALGLSVDCVCLIRPDMHCAAKVDSPTLPRIRRALNQALGKNGNQQ